MNRILFIGNIGSDAGGWYIGADGKIHRIPGWEPDQMRDVAHALQGLRSLSQVKRPGLAEKMAAGIMDILGKELDAHLKEGDVLVIG